MTILDTAVSDLALQGRRPSNDAPYLKAAMEHFANGTMLQNPHEGNLVLAEQQLAAIDAALIAPVVSEEGTITSPAGSLYTALQSNPASLESLKANQIKTKALVADLRASSTRVSTSTNPHEPRMPLPASIAMSNDDYASYLANLEPSELVAYPTVEEYAAQKAQAEQMGVPPVLEIMSTAHSQASLDADLGRNEDDPCKPVSGSMGDILSGVGDALSTITSALTPIVSAITESVANIVGVISSSITAVVSAIGKVASKIISALANIAKATAEVAAAAFATVMKAMAGSSPCMANTLGVVNPEMNAGILTPEMVTLVSGDPQIVGMLDKLNAI